MMAHIMPCVALQPARAARPWVPAGFRLRRSAREQALDLTEYLPARMRFPGAVVHRSLTPDWSRFRLPHIAQRETVGWAFAVDRGGTFTDVVGTAPDGSLHTCKVLSRDPHRPADPALRGIDLLLEQHGAACGRRVTSVRLGTTVATNALLERTGAPTLLVTSQGMRDALLIGYQDRPDIFARAIRRPSPLYRDVVEIPERVDAQGQVLLPLDEDALRRALVAARAAGIEAVAIAFLHGFRHPAHEIRAAEIARAAGFEEVIASHAAAPLLGFVARGDTTVADAYLSPVLLRYTQNFRASLRAAHGDATVAFMQSNGGLVDAEGFRGVNGILSGPAGGVVGMIAAGTAEGPRRLIGFDMGGTSTDVSLSTGDIPRRFAAEIDGVRLQTPMVDITTIAAGGGSVLRFADGRLQVGPASAGADPGPACYRRNGPATITDCNVVLGRIPADRFPHVFGPTGDQPIDPTASRARLAELAAAAHDEAGLEYSVEALAEAFLQVACARMANAIRELALHHGEDPARFGLLSFGGAAGQHACAVAGLLGADEVLLHPLAGVLSAYGIGLTGRRAIRRRTVEAALDAPGHAAGRQTLQGLETDARDDLLRQGVAVSLIEMRSSAHVRLAGSDTTLELRWQSADTLRVAFFEAHRQLYGFADETATLVIGSVMAEAIERVAAAAPNLATASEPLIAEAATPAASASVWIEGAARTVPVVGRRNLAAGAQLHGPLLLCEDGATSWIAPGWAGRVAPSGLVVLHRSQAARGIAHAGRVCHRTRSDAARGVQRVVHARRGADGCRAATHGEFGQHQGAARLFVRDLRCRGEPRGQCATHAGAPGVDGRERGRRARHVRRRVAPWGCLPGELAVRRRHPPARHDGRLTGLRRGRRPHRILYGLACASRRRGRDLARLHAAGQPHHRRRRRAGGADAHHARRSARRCTAAPAVLRQPLARTEFPAEPRGSAGAAGGKFPWRAGIAPRRGGPWRRHAARVHAPRAGQRRTLRAPRDPPAARRQLPLRDGQRPGDRRAHRRRAASRHGRRRLRGHIAATGQQLQRATVPSRLRRCSTSSAR